MSSSNSIRRCSPGCCDRPPSRADGHNKRQAQVKKPWLDQQTCFVADGSSDRGPAVGTSHGSTWSTNTEHSIIKSETSVCGQDLVRSKLTGRFSRRSRLKAGRCVSRWPQVCNGPATRGRKGLNRQRAERGPAPGLAVQASQLPSHCKPIVRPFDQMRSNQSASKTKSGCTSPRRPDTELLPAPPDKISREPPPP